jgi:hypothetical protein
MDCDIVRAKTIILQGGQKCVDPQSSHRSRPIPAPEIGFPATAWGLRWTALEIIANDNARFILRSGRRYLYFIERNRRCSITRARWIDLD